MLLGSSVSLLQIVQRDQDVLVKPQWLRHLESWLGVQLHKKDKINLSGIFWSPQRLLSLCLANLKQHLPLKTFWESFQSDVSIREKVLHYLGFFSWYTYIVLKLPRLNYSFSKSWALKQWFSNWCLQLSGLYRHSKEVAKETEQ